MVTIYADTVSDFASIKEYRTSDNCKDIVQLLEQQLPYRILAGRLVLTTGISMLKFCIYILFFKLFEELKLYYIDEMNLALNMNETMLTTCLLYTSRCV